MASNGTNIKITIGGAELVGELSNALDSSGDIIDVSSKKSGRVRKILGGRVVKTVNFESLADDLSSDYGWADAHAAAAAGTNIAWVIIAGATTIESGNGFLSSLTKDQPDKDRSTFSGSIRVTKTAV